MVKLNIYTSLIISVTIQIITYIIEVITLFIKVPTTFSFLKQMMLLEVIVQLHRPKRKMRQKHNYYLYIL